MSATAEQIKTLLLTRFDAARANWTRLATDVSPTLLQQIMAYVQSIFTAIQNNDRAFSNTVVLTAINAMKANLPGLLNPLLITDTDNNFVKVAQVECDIWFYLFNDYLLQLDFATIQLHAQQLDQAAAARLPLNPQPNVPAAAPVDPAAIPVAPVNPAAVRAAPAVQVAADDPALDAMNNNEVLTALNAYKNGYNSARPAAEHMNVVTVPRANPLEDIHYRLVYQNANIKPIEVTRNRGQNLVLSTTETNDATREQQAKILFDMPPAGAKTIKITADDPNFIALFSAMRGDPYNHHVELSITQIEIVRRNPGLQHLVEQGSVARQVL